MNIQLFCILIAFLLPIGARAQVSSVRGSGITMGERLDFYSQRLKGNSVVNVYLPSGYKESDTTRYPVVYLLDGALDEDFLHVTGLYQFYSSEWVGYIDKSIVVGIVASDRRKHYTFRTSIASDSIKYPSSGHSEEFMDYLERELQPFINSRYRTTRHKTLIGQSLAGLFATEVLFKRPTLFTRYLIVSPSIWWDNGSILGYDPSSLKTLKHQVQIYIGVGKEGLTPSATGRTMEQDAKLLSRKIEGLVNKNLNLYFDYLPSEDHATVLHQALANALRYCSHNYKK